MRLACLQASDLQDLYGTLDDDEMKLQVIFVASQTSERAAIDFLMDVALNEEDRELKQRAIFCLLQFSGRSILTRRVVPFD